MTRYRVTIFEIDGPQINDTFIRATDTIGALQERVGDAPGPVRLSSAYVLLVAEVSS